MDLTTEQARNLWIDAQRLNVANPFDASTGAATVANCVRYLGYVQIDTINVIERCHHHILFNRIPGYKIDDLLVAQRDDRTLFETWTHALSYVHVDDFRFFVHRMKEYRDGWFGQATPADVRRVLARVRTEGGLTIRDVKDDVLIEKTHEWASKKPSKKALEIAFHQGRLVISERLGMVKKYELTERHFGWDRLPKGASLRERLEYRLDRALRTQAFVSLDSVAYLEPSAKPAFAKLIKARQELEPVTIDGRGDYWWQPRPIPEPSALTHILSPFDPLVIQRKRLRDVFGYEHKFEAYVPAAKRVYGYFALPVLVENEIVALLDLKTDRQNQELLIQKWSWLPKQRSKERRRLIEEELHRFEAFQLSGSIKPTRSSSPRE